MNERSDSSEFQRLARERDLYRHILELDSKHELGELLADALALIVGATGAQHGYLEVRDGEREFWIAHDCSKDEVADIRSAISRGISRRRSRPARRSSRSRRCSIRASRSGSVQLGRIEAVLCAPIGRIRPSGRCISRAGGRGPFSEDDRGMPSCSPGIWRRLRIGC